jgi:hypothetical protein
MRLHSSPAWATLACFLFAGAAHAVNPVDIWLKRTPLPEENDLEAIAYGNGLYVAVGDKGVILTSTNGTRWQSVRPETDMRLRFVAFGGGVFVAAGWGNSYYRTNIALVSSNGTDWVPTPLSNFGDVAGMAYGNGRFVINKGEESPPSISLDGWTWTDGVLIEDDIEDVAWGAGRFAAADYQSFLSSTNGIDWDVQDAPFLGTAKMAFLNNLFVAAGDAGPFGGNETNFATSPDALNWTTSIFTCPFNTAGGNVHALGYVNGRLVIIGSLNGKPASWISPDNGQQWQATPALTLSDEPAAILSETNRLISVGPKGEIAISANGLLWTNVNGRTPQRPLSVAYSGDRFIAVGMAGGVKMSMDGISWETQIVLATNRTWWGVADGDGRFVIVGSSGSVATSTNGRDWLTLTLPGFYDIRSVAYGAGRFVAVGSGSGLISSHQVFVSTDGLSWSNALSGTSFSLFGVTRANGLFIAVGSNGRILTSADGITWAQYMTDSSVRFQSVAFGNGRYVAVGAKVGVDMTLSVPAVYFSTNGTAWLPATITATNTTKFDLYSVAFGDGVFVAAAGHAPSIGSMGGMLFSSTDGQAWQHRYTLPVSLESQDFTGVAYGLGTFVAVGPTGVIYQTPDVRARLRVEPSSPAGTNSHRLWLSGYSNALYVVESSTNLLHWEPRSTNRVFAHEIEIPNASSPAAVRFHRALLIPE